MMRVRHGRFGQIAVYGKAAGGGGGYTGPGDIVSFFGWWGLRAYSAAAAAAAGPCIDILDQAGANAITIHLLTNGKLDTASISAWVTTHSVTTICVTKLYDQASTNHMTQATLANMPTLNITGGPGGNTPALIFVGSSSQTLAALSSNQAQPVSLSAVAERTGAFTSFGTVISYGGTSDFGFNSATNTAYIYAGAVVTATATDSAWHAMQGLLNGATSAIYIDGTNTGSLSAGTTATGGGNTTIGVGLGGHLTGSASEFGVVAGDASANFSAVNGNQHAFWGF